jgi:glycosyltransferase involved in cell wall biosynthesis
MERIFYFCFNNRAAYCLFQNSDDSSLFLERNWTTPERSFVINGAGIDLKNPVRDGNANKPIVFLFAGRLLWDKGIRELVEACSILKSKNLPFRCEIAGLVDSTNKAAVPLSYVDEQHRNGVLEWLGPRTDVPRLMSAADCFVFPSSYREGVPKVLLEASAAGIPMITTNMPGCRDVVKAGFNGFVVPPKDPESLAAAMEECIRSPHDLRRLGQNARRHAELHFGVEKVIEEHSRIFHLMAAQRGFDSFSLRQRRLRSFERKEAIDRG